MQIYDKRNDKSYRTAPKCGYCRQEGHNQYNCPEVAKDWAWWKVFTVPPYSTASWLNRSNPKYWGEWYQKCKDLYNEQQRRAKAPKVKRTKSESKCGFCGEYGHNRRNCKEMEAFKQKCYKANENWRRAAYKELVEKHGICVGAAIEVKKRDGWGSNSQTMSEVALITKVNFESLNVMAAKTGYYNGYTNPYDCSIKVHALVDCKEHLIKVHTDERSYSDTWQKDFIQIDHKTISLNHGGHYMNWHLSKVISRSEHPLDENWVTDYRGAFDLLLKKRSKEQLDNDGITSLINKWAKKV